MFAELTNPIGVLRLIAQGCQTIVQATLGEGLVCREQRHRCCAFLISSFQKGEGLKESVFHEDDEPHRGSAFDSPGLASIASYPGLMCCMGYNAIGVALF